MTFNSFTFIVFFLCVLALHSLPLRWRIRKFNLLWASYLFYAAWNPPFVSLLVLSTLTDWFVVRKMATVPRKNKVVRWHLLLISLGVNLGLLGFFKYAGFVLDNFVWFVNHVLHVPYAPATPSIILPVGISFYTFQTLSYTIDVYRGKSKPWASFLDFALFVSFFPQLVAGPIVRSRTFLPQCIEPRRGTASQIGWGLTLLVFGLFEKIVLADAIMAPVANQVFDATGQADFFDAWVGALAFSSQIFFDFAGYSICAIGTALCLGFALPDNFRCPYGSVGAFDFWRRWHISLSSWLRDYLYVPLSFKGGKRRGEGRTRINLMITMLLGGLWHGAAWRFVIWGGMQGAYLMVEDTLQKLYGNPKWTQTTWGRFLLAQFTFFCFIWTWVVFRAEHASDAFNLFGAMLGYGGVGLEIGRWRAYTVGALTAWLVLSHWFMRDTSLEHLAQKFSWKVRAVAVALMIIAINLSSGEEHAFIYFQF